MQGQILLLRQYRHATRSWHSEFPRGFGSADVGPRDNARKELMEETGGQIDALCDLGNYHINTGLEAVVVRLYFAKLRSVGTPNTEEGIERFEWVSLSSLEELIRGGQITDGFTIAAYSRAKLKGLV